MIKVSIIVPVYNTEKYLKKCIDSLINQTEEEIEIIILNDGSPDNSDSVIKSYDDSRIKYIKKDNTGIGSTRNLGIDTAIGKYVMFIDSDDFIEKNCVEVMLEKAEKDKCDIVISDYYEDRNDDIIEIHFNQFSDTSLDNNPAILNNINLGPCNKIYKKSILKGIRFEEKLKYEDAPFVIKALKAAKKIGKIGNCLSHYVIHSNSQTTVRDKRIFDILEISKIIINTLKEKEYKEVLTNLIVMILADYTIQQRYISNKKDRNEFIDKSFALMDSVDKEWRNCDYLKRFRIHERIIKKSKLLTKIYCGLYNKFK